MQYVGVTIAACHTLLLHLLQFFFHSPVTSPPHFARLLCMRAFLNFHFLSFRVEKRNQIWNIIYEFLLAVLKSTFPPFQIWLFHLRFHKQPDQLSRRSCVNFHNDKIISETMDLSIVFPLLLFYFSSFLWMSGERHQLNSL